jgi:hypothetical protein
MLATRPRDGPLKGLTFSIKLSPYYSLATGEANFVGYRQFRKSRISKNIFMIYSDCNEGKTYTTWI